jgi:hypothetical protein
MRAKYPCVVKSQGVLSRRKMAPGSIADSIFISKKSSSYIGRGHYLPSSLSEDDLMVQMRKIRKELKRANISFIQERIDDIRESYIFLSNTHPNNLEVEASAKSLSRTVVYHAWNWKIAKPILTLLKDSGRIAELEYVADNSHAESSVRDYAANLILNNLTK